MSYINNAALIKRQLMVRLARMMFAGNLGTHVDFIPLQQAPRESESVRCCIHHDRAVLRYRLMALLGFAVENEKPEDEIRTLASYVAEAGQKGADRFDDKILTVIDEACSSCVRANYRVTNACRGCVARQCQMNCPKKAIRIENGHAVIDEKICVSCGICAKACPYHSIIFQPIPCEEACPVGAISQDERGKEKIDEAKCIHCGRCMQACPFGAIMERSEMFDVLRDLLDPAKNTVAMIAPAIVGQFNTDLGKVVTALKKLGFDHVVEVAYGADLTADRETAEFVERIGHGALCMTSSCCPAYVEAVNKHIGTIKNLVSDTPSPMQLAGEWAGKQWPGARRVFIGPCVAKRAEALASSNVENVMTFEELGSTFVAAGIDVFECADTQPDQIATATGRKFAVAGGVAGAVRVGAAANGVQAEEKLFNGLDKKAFATLRAVDKIIKKPTFIEVMTCEGGCMHGPGVISNPVVARSFLEKLVAEKK